MDETPASPTILGIPVEVAFSIFALLVAVNLAYLDVLIIQLLNNTHETPNASVQSVASLAKDAYCPDACIAQIQNLATASVQLVSSPPPPQTSVTSTRIPVSVVREFFVPFGTGQGNSTDWTDLAGLSATIDTTNYVRLKSVVFEATMRIPTGNEAAYARLFNVTDKHPVWFSEVSLDGGVAKLISSSPITLDPGSKTYQVQIKTGLGYPLYIDQARLHILTY
jgi:hypothetical protein